jgi:hypothetical protein
MIRSPATAERWRSSKSVASPRWRSVRFLSVLLVVGVLAAGHPATGADTFRITDVHDQPTPGDPAHMAVRGTVLNTDRRTVLNVYVTAEALDSSHHVVATGVAYVTSAIEGSRSAPFVVTLRRVNGVVDYRVLVTSFRFGLGPQAP